ncbi:PTS sugar transporter subunit IIA [Enterococcus sp. AZ103]|uniref:PTS sugar transporter subunit IIA n=1 Tax=Enterococcus sp. AZ103 TaxID=2774628 RepID=UPI003F683F16
MMKKLVLVSHGNFCVELKKSTEMIMGKQEDIVAVPLLPEEGQEDFSKKFEAAVSSFGNDFIVFADILGGTPANVLSKLLMEGWKFDVYTGMNMPMVVSFINSMLINSAPKFLDDGKESILYLNDRLSGDSDDED